MFPCREIAGLHVIGGLKGVAAELSSITRSIQIDGRAIIMADGAAKRSIELYVSVILMNVLTSVA